MKSFLKRRTECNTDTQYKVMLSGYHWCVEQIKNIASCTVLDAACGTGYGSYCISAKAKKVIGIDISSKAIDLCKKKYKRDNLIFLQMDCTDLKFNDDSFDVVISQDTIEHIRDDKKFLSEVKRVLKHNGILVIFTPHSLTHNERPANVYHLREYSKDRFEKLIANYFSDIKFYGRRLSPGLAKLERDLNKIRCYDKFGIRIVIPRRIRHLIGNLLAKAKGDKRLEDVSCKDIEYFDGVQGTSTLIAVCKNG